MNETKVWLIIEHGTVCMLCGKDVGRKIQWHHIRPKYDFKRCNEKIDDSVENGSLLCPDCHKLIHRYDYIDYRYKRLTLEIKKNKGE